MSAQIDTARPAAKQSSSHDEATILHSQPDNPSIIRVECVISPFTMTEHPVGTIRSSASVIRSNTAEHDSIEQQPTQQRTLVDYWDDFYGANESSIEWIVPPNACMMDHMRPHIPIVANAPCRIVEIGCGTSTLARELLVYLQDNDTDVRIQMTATDVSETAIQQNKRRDTENNNNMVEYLVWDVLADAPGKVFDNPVFDVVLDKGCFDTILFRTAKRKVEQVAAKFLNHVVECMSENSVYLIVTPRRKHGLLKTFQGFVSTERHSLASTASAEIYKADKNTQSYLHVCRKRMDYKPGVDEAFIKEAPTATAPAICPSCGLLEQNFRHQGKDRVREWTGHCAHCKDKP